MHDVPVHEAPMLFVVSQVLPQPAQLVTLVVAVSHPFVSGETLSQSAKPARQPLYEHVDAPRQMGPVLLTVSHATPHPPQSVVVLSDVSHPSLSGAVFTQSPKPETQPE